MSTTVSAAWVASSDASSCRLILWTAQRSNNDDSCWQLEYVPQVVDTYPQFTHLPTWVKTRNAAIVHVASSTVQKPRLYEALIECLSQKEHYHALSLEDETPEEAVPTTNVQIHESAPGAASWTHTQTILEQLLSSEQWLRLQGNVHFADTNVQKSLSFFLHITQLAALGSSKVSIDQGVLTSHLWLDHTAAEAIHLFPPRHLGEATTIGGHAHNNSLWGILKEPLCTKMGARELKLWLQQPLVQLNAIQKRQDAVTTLVQQGVARDALRAQGLKLFTADLAKLAQKLSHYLQATANNEDGGPAFGATHAALECLYDLYLLSAQHVPLLAELLQQIANPDALLGEIYQEILDVQAPLARSTQLAEAVLDLDRAPREFLIRASYKEELADISAELQKLQNELDDCRQEMQDNWDSVSGSSSTTIRLETDGEHTYVFRLPNTNDSKLLEQHCDVKVHKLLKNGVYFTNKSLRQFSCQKQDLVAEYDRHQRQVVIDAMQVASTYQAVVERVSRAVATLDVIAAFAHVAAYNPHGYCRPILTDGEEDGLGIELEAARHPCVELQENVDYIPNNVNLIFGKSSFLFVTGPNSGGKSCYIRALGAIVTLAQIGAYVPCTSAKINICHHILARVGAGDMQERGISTFMAEMLESSSILRMTTKRSLIIIDELGRGTSTFDGYGLARAISEYIVQKIGCMTVFATHFHELTALEDQEPEVKNCHVTAQKGSHGLTFLYEVKPGPCLESFGIQVAEMANMPQVVVQDARKKAKELENFEYRRTDDGAAEVASANDHDLAETAAAAIDFVNRFRRVDLPAILDQEYASNDDKRRALLLALQV